MKLKLNGEDMGLFTVIEDVDDTWAARHGLHGCKGEARGALWKPEFFVWKLYNFDEGIEGSVNPKNEQPPEAYEHLVNVTTELDAIVDAETSAGFMTDATRAQSARTMVCFGTLGEYGTEYLLACLQISCMKLNPC